MATIINNPDTSDAGSPGLILSIVVGLILIALFFMYGLPALRNSGNQSGTNIDVNLPDNSGQTPSGQ